MGKIRGVVPSSWHPRGEAVAAVQGEDRPLLVWQGIVGEAADVELGHVGQHQAYGHWVHAREHHPDRVHPVCPRYTRCGGCALMHLGEAGQERARRAMVRDALDGAGLSDVEVGPWTASPDGLTAFRHVVKVGFDTAPTGRLRMGAWGRNTREVVPIPKCDVAAEVLRKVMASLAHHAIGMGLTAYDPETDRGVLRAAVLRASRFDGRVLITLVAGRRVRQLRDLAEAVARGCPEVHGVWLHLHQDPGNAIFSRGEDGAVGVVPIVGADALQERLGEVTYLVGPGDFFQTNPGTAAALYVRVLEVLAPGSDDAFVDLYCGVGGIALQAARAGAFVVGVEEGIGAVERARLAAHHNRLTARFTAGRVVDVLPQLAEQVGESSPLVAVNPARRGLEPGVVDGIAALRPRRVAYVSCNPRALARDLALFRDQGFTVRPLELFDMFPNTPHVEVLAVLEPAEAPTSRRRPPRRKVVRR